MKPHDLYNAIINGEYFHTISEKLRGVAKAHCSYGDPALYEGGNSIENQTV